MSELLRRPGSAKRSEMPRMSFRYGATGSSVAMTLPTKRSFGRERFVDVETELLDVSIGGALVVVPNGVTIQEGVRVELALEGEYATVGVRHVEPMIDGRCRCGVAFRMPSPAFEAIVNETIASLITDPKRNEAWRMNR